MLLQTFCMKDADDKDWLIEDEPSDSFVAGLAWRVLGGDMEIGDKILERKKPMCVGKIPFNIWDDYYDEDCIPEGEKQVTHGYVELLKDEITEEQRSEIVSLILDNLLTLDLPSVDLENINNRIYFTNLTHKRRYKLIEELELLQLKYHGIPIEFYSES